jgi:hypothetical protein
MAINDVAFKRFSDDGLPTSDTTLYTAPASTTSLLLSVIFSNSSVSQIEIEVEIVRNGGTPILVVVTGAPIPPGAALDIIENKPIILETGDLIRARVVTGTATDCDVVGSVMETT